MQAAHGFRLVLVTAARLATAAAVAALAACGSTPPAHHDAGVCAEYRATIAGKSPEEQRAAAAAHIVRMHGAADPQHVERHLRMMQQRCGS